MATFDKSKVICGANVEKAVIGKKYWFADRIGCLEKYVEGITPDDACILKQINNHSELSPFVNEKDFAWEFIYPYEEPEEVWYVYKVLSTENKYAMSTTVFCMPSEFEGTEEECKQWIKDHEVTPEEPPEESSEEESSEQRMTNLMLMEWISKRNGIFKYGDLCYTSKCFVEHELNDAVDENIVVRSWDSEEWVEPTYEVYLRDCKGVTQDDIDDVAYRDGC